MHGSKTGTSSKLEVRGYIEKKLNVRLVDSDGKTRAYCRETGEELMRFYAEAQIRWMAQRISRGDVK